MGHDLGIVPAEVQGQSGRSYDQHRADIDVRHDQDVSGPERHRRSGVHDVDIRHGRCTGRSLRPDDSAGDSGTQPRRHRDEILQQIERQIDICQQDLLQRVVPTKKHHPPTIHVDFRREAIEYRGEFVRL